MKFPSRGARHRKNQRGFALLLVFLMAAMIAITLYMELPRLAMEAQRDKEQTLIDRGEQYKRAIQLYVAKAKRYPGDIKELENFQNQRFLRHRYVDPMTGKDEWRVIHIQNGMLTDSKVTKPNGPGGKEDPKVPNGFVGEQVALGGTVDAAQSGGAASVRDRRRTSEGANASMPGPAVPSGDQAGGQNSGMPTLPGQMPGTVGANLPGANPNNQIIQPSYVPPGGLITGPGASSGSNVGRNLTQPGNTSSASNSFVGGGGSFVGGSSSFVGGSTATGSNTNSGTPNYSGQPGPAVNSQTQGVSPYPIAQGSNGLPPGFPQPGTTTGTGQANSAADMIRNILTTPRPGGMPAMNPGAQTLGGTGIAGVASNAEGEGVKVYNDRSLYQEWEFIFDPAKLKQIPNPNATGLGGTPASKIGQTAGQQSTNPGFGSQTTPSVPGR